MAQDDKYKEGVDFEWVIMKNQPKGGTNKTRHFFTKAEKDAMKAPKPKATAPKTSPKPKARPKAASKVNGVRPEGKPAGMPKAKKAAQSTARPEGAAKGAPAGKPFILGRFGSQAAVRPETKAKVKDKPKAKSTGAKATFLLKGKK